MSDSILDALSDDFDDDSKPLTEAEKEQRRRLLRRARQQAERKKLAADKRKTKPTPEQVIEDVRRVAFDKDTNPLGYRTGSISRTRYDLYGHYRIEYLDAEFGTWQHIKEIAGLIDKPGTRLRKSVTSKFSRTQHAAEWMEERILPYALKDPSLEREVNEAKLWLLISDTHAQHLDPFTWWCFLGCVKALKPDGVILNGDILEGSAISSHPKIPGAVIPLSLEFAFARTMFEQLREVHSGDILWNAGNHGLDRLARYVSQECPAFSELIKFDELAGLKDLDVKLCQQGSICSPEGQEERMPGVVLYGKAYNRHGVSVGASAANTELARAHMSGSTGHLHRPHIVYATSMTQQGMSHMVTGMGCTPAAGRAYMKGPTTGWSRGFGSQLFLPGAEVIQNLISTEGGACAFEGHILRRTKPIPAQDIMSNWLEEFTIGDW